MNILDKIIHYKREEVAVARLKTPVEMLEKQPHFLLPVNKLTESILDPQKTGIIAEFKRKSPSKGIINDKVSTADVTSQYVAGGASGLSVLTDNPSFGGSLEDLIAAREANKNIPILRKDFMIDEYQIIEAKAAGADVILLIAACLSDKEAKRLSECAKLLGLQILMEVHNKEELKKVNKLIDLVGVNNRNLKNFKVDINISIELSKHIPDSFIKISESGINDPENIKILKTHGYKGFLVGECFMRENNPGVAFSEFAKKLKA